jgi:hypothetical protein
MELCASVLVARCKFSMMWHRVVWWTVTAFRQNISGFMFRAKRDRIIPKPPLFIHLTKYGWLHTWPYCGTDAFYNQNSTALSLDQQLANFNVYQHPIWELQCIILDFILIILVTTVFYTIFIRTFKALRVFYPGVRICSDNTSTRHASHPVVVQRSVFYIFGVSPDVGVTEYRNMSGLEVNIFY